MSERSEMSEMRVSCSFTSSSSASTRELRDDDSKRAEEQGAWYELGTNASKCVMVVVWCSVARRKGRTEPDEEEESIQCKPGAAAHYSTSQ